MDDVDSDQNKVYISIKQRKQNEKERNKLQKSE